jgi:molecular chaperone DnaK
LNLGGDDFDYSIVQWLLKDLRIKQNANLYNDPRVIYRLKEAAEKAKIELSESIEAKINIPFISVGSVIKNLETTITRRDFEMISAHLIEKSKDVCYRAMKIADYENQYKQKYDEVIFVGGSTRIPKIQEEISKIFKLKPNKNFNPDEIVP